MKLNHLFFLIIIVLLTSCKATEYYKNQYSTKANKEKIFHLSENLDATIKKVWGNSMYIDMGRNYYTYDGYYYANISINILNNSNKKLEFHFNDFILINKNGIKYPVKFINHGPFDSKYIKPKQSKSKSITFLCDTDFKPYMLVHKNPNFKPIVIDYITTK